MQMLRFLLAFALLALAGPVAIGAEAGHRTALVIGNGQYQHAAPLLLPAGDAAAMAEMLRRLDFEVMHHADLDLKGMTAALQTFLAASRDAEIALVYFSGYSLVRDSRSYLVPVDARLTRDRDLEVATIALDVLVANLGSNGRFRVILLDACRGNPFAATWVSHWLGVGRVAAEPADDMLISFAAATSTCDPPDAKHRLYTQALLDVGERPGLEIAQLFSTVRDMVMRASGGRQAPVFYASLPGREIFLKAPLQP